MGSVEQAGAGTALTIGFFDGVHRGHQVLLQRVLAAAARLGARPVAVTFDLHSLEVLHGRGPLKTILTTAEKVALLRACGLDDVVVYHFTPEFAAQSGQEFVENALVAELQARSICVGRDFRFGHHRSCGAADLAALAGRHGVEVDIVDLVGADGHKVGSRAIRAELAVGDVATAAAMLGRPYTLTGTVVEGRRLGRTIGFPTANLAVDPRKIVPEHGVYAVRWAGRPGVLNIGVRPTVGGVAETIEAHWLDYSGDLYGATLTVEFVARLRPERRFADLAALQTQIAHDVARARQVLEQTP